MSLSTVEKVAVGGFVAAALVLGIVLWAVRPATEAAVDPSQMEPPIETIAIPPSASLVAPPEGSPRVPPPVEDDDAPQPDHEATFSEEEDSVAYEDRGQDDEEGNRPLPLPPASPTILRAPPVQIDVPATESPPPSPEEDENNSAEQETSDPSATEAPDTTSGAGGGNPNVGTGGASGSPSDDPAPTNGEFTSPEPDESPPGAF